MNMKRIASIAAVPMLCLALVACGKGSLEQSLLDEASGVKVVAENAGTGTQALTESAITVEEGDLIVISPMLDKGSFHLTITSDADKTVIYDEDVDGQVLFSIEAAPGSYTVATGSNDATGEMTVFAEDADEYASLDASLAEALEDATDAEGDD